jgi:3-oxoadipate enol-lactonase
MTVWRSHAAHISNVEQPHAFTDAVIGFLTQR